MNRFLLFIACSMCVFSSGFTKQNKYLLDKYNTPVTQIIPLSQLDEATVQSFVEESHPEIALRCPEGSELPLRYLGDFKAFSLQFDPNVKIRLEKECYIRIIKRQKSVTPYISFDLIQWEKLSSYLRGKVSPSFGCGHSPFVSIKTDLKK